MFWTEHFNEFIVRRFHIPDETLPIPQAYTMPNHISGIRNNDNDDSDDEGQYQIGELYSFLPKPYSLPFNASIS